MASSKRQPPLNTSTMPLNSNDVLFGRGTAANSYIGNKKFRDIVETRKEEYNATSNHKLKNGIAKEVFEQVRNTGGRFMKQVEMDRKVENIVKDCDWVEATPAAALEKCKQSLRQHEKKSGKQEESRHTNNVKKKRNRATTNATSIKSIEHPSPAAARPTAVASMSPPSIMGSLDSCADPRLLLFRDSPIRYSQQQLQPMAVPQHMLVTSSFHQFGHNNSYQDPAFAMAQPVASAVTSRLTFQDFCDSMDAAEAAARQGHLPDNARYAQLRRPETPSLPLPESGAFKVDQSNEGGSASESSRSLDTPSLRLLTKGGGLKTDKSESLAELKQEYTSERSSQSTLDEDVSTFLLSALEEQNQPRLTAKELEAEWANMSDDEKAAALTDVFGMMCDYNTQHKDKKSRRDLDPKSIAFLVKQVRLEIERIPDSEKSALLEAQLYANAEEFSDGRLLHFLRCDSMHSKLAARRFVNYWDGRREVFGPERYLLPIKLSEALSGDMEAIRALEAGVICLLPHLDISGRQLLFLTPRRHTKNGYSSLGLLRAVWYIIEIAARQNNDIVSGLVEIVWDKDSSVWDYDSQVYSRWTYFETHAWPVQITAFHVCCPPPFIKRIIFPIMMALTDKRARARTLIHDVPESDIVKVLENYGILKSMLPTDVGGDVVLDHVGWIAERRVAELDEI